MHRARLAFDGMEARVVPQPLAKIPNALTVVRLALIPVFVVVVLAADGEGSVAAAALFAAAGATDQVDGWLARLWRVESEFGKFADPLADRLMIDAAVVLLWLDGRLPWPALAVILLRDAVLIGGYRLVMNRGYEFSVSTLGKAATWVLYAALTGLLASGPGTDWALGLFWSGLALALAAAALYAVSAIRSVAR
jgi:CDP-diacylglycerol--glycerol-3-phosphate 3-phosphatidyltransferase